METFTELSNHKTWSGTLKMNHDARFILEKSSWVMHGGRRVRPRHLDRRPGGSLLNCTVLRIVSYVPYLLILFYSASCQFNPVLTITSRDVGEPYCQTFLGKPVLSISDFSLIDKPFSQKTPVWVCQ